MAELISHSHGKGRVRIARRWREVGPDGRTVDVMKEWKLEVIVRCAACESSYTDGDNRYVIATDSVKNSVYKVAKHGPTTRSAEDFAAAVAANLTAKYDFVQGCSVVLEEIPWRRVVDEHGVAHEHAFVGGGETRMVWADATRPSGRASEGTVTLAGGFRDLRLLKTTQSGWEKFVKDDLTLLPETRERMMASSVTCRWEYAGAPRSFPLGRALPVVRLSPQHGSDYNAVYSSVVSALCGAFTGPARGGTYSPGVQATLYQMGTAALSACPQLATITLEMPNLHFVPQRLPAPVNVTFEDDVYVPMDEPHGMIRATLARPRSRM